MWAIDFQADLFADGTGLTIASIIDQHIRLVLDDPVDTSISGEDIVNILEHLALVHGMLAILHIDNGPELTSQTIAKLAEGVVDLAFIPPGNRRRTATLKHSTHANATSRSTSPPSRPCYTPELNTPISTANATPSTKPRLGYKTPTENTDHCT